MVLLQAGGRIHGVFLLGREERVYSLQPGHSWSDRSNSSDTDFEGQIGHRQPGHSGTETCCVSAPGRRRVTKCQDTSSASATTFRAATFWRGNVSHSRRALARMGRWVREISEHAGVAGCGMRLHATHNSLQAQDSLQPHFPTHHSLYKMRLPSINFIHSSVFVTTTINDEAA